MVSFIGLPVIACLIPIYSEHYLETPLVENMPVLRRLPAPWSVEELKACFVVHGGDIDEAVVPLRLVLQLERGRACQKA